jgi:hypothetical protein
MKDLSDLYFGNVAVSTTGVTARRTCATPVSNGWITTVTLIKVSTIGGPENRSFYGRIATRMCVSFCSRGPE